MGSIITTAKKTIFLNLTFIDFGLVFAIDELLILCNVV